MKGSIRMSCFRRPLFAPAGARPECEHFPTAWRSRQRHRHSGCKQADRDKHRMPDVEHRTAKSQRTKGYALGSLRLHRGAGIRDIRGVPNRSSSASRLCWLGAGVSRRSKCSPPKPMPRWSAHFALGLSYECRLKLAPRGRLLGASVVFTKRGAKDEQENTEKTEATTPFALLSPVKMPHRRRAALLTI